MTDGCDISSDIALRWTSLNLSDDKSTLVQVMAWCRQATSHYLDQCWPRSPTPYGVTRPQWVNPLLRGPQGTLPNAFYVEMLTRKYCDTIRMEFEILTFHSRKCIWKMWSGKWWPFCVSLTVLRHADVGGSVSDDRWTTVISCNLDPGTQRNSEQLSVVSWSISYEFVYKHYISILHMIK